jgi:uncharacterized protein (DUF1501 family)
MKRRSFIKKAVPVSLLPFFIDGITIKAFGRSPLINLLTRASVETDRVLVLIQLNGGNDGLNTVIPLDQYSTLAKARPRLLVPESKVLRLTGVDGTGFHPAMPELRNLYDSGKLSVVQSVGYPGPNFSHFRSTEIWLTAADADQKVLSGWGGRYLEEEFPGYPEGYPNALMPDPLALQIGTSVSPAFDGHDFPMGMAITNVNTFYNLVTGTKDPVPDTPAGEELQFIREVASQTEKFSVSIKTAADKARNLSALYPDTGKNSLADQLKIVARLIAGGLKTRMFMVNLAGFDTHASQGADSGPHAYLLNKVSVAINAFQDDLRLLGLENRVSGMTFSEFGRRIVSNASLGTDHGAAAPLFVFGSQVNPGFIGSNPVIKDGVTSNDNVEMQHDLRRVYSSVLRDWFGTSVDEETAVLMHQFDTLPIFKNPIINGVKTSSGDGLQLQQNFPNPFANVTTIRFRTDREDIRLVLLDAQGRELRTLARGKYNEGVHEILLDASQLPSGIYYYQLETKKIKEAKSMVCRK